MVSIPGEWQIDGLSDTREAINAIPPKDAPSRASLVAGPSLPNSITANNKATALLSSTKAQSICALPAYEIVEAIKNKQLTSVEVTEAFLVSAAVAQQATGCLSEFFPEEARARARELDAKQARGEALGVLHGLPVSLKGHIFLAGHGNQNGFAVDVLPQETYDALLSNPDSPALRNLAPAHIALLKARGPRFSAEDGLLARILREQGTVFYCKTTMPQSVMHLDTRSTPFGQTVNPYNLALSAGGSSGGEAALISGGGSVLGVGTDIGGSVRQPCSVTGLWGLRPTCGRLPSTSNLAPTPGNTMVVSTIGPMCRSLKDVSIFMAAVLRGEPWKLDPNTYRLPWREEVVRTPRKESLRIGILRHDGLVRPTTPIRRALSSVTSRLRDRKNSNAESLTDIELVEVDAGDLHARAWILIRSLYYVDGGAFTHSLAALGDEPLLPLTEKILEDAQERTAHEIWELTVNRESIKREYLKWWSDLRLDAILCPASATVAPRPGTIKYWGYTSAFNLFDLPSLVFPTGISVNAEADMAFEASEGSDSPSRSKVNNADTGDWDRENEEEYVRHRDVYEGAPVGLQLVGSRFEEEELIQVMRVIEQAL